MKFKSLAGFAAALSMVAMPIAASAAPVANPASALSLSNAPSARVGSSSTKASRYGSGAIIGGLILVGVIALAVVAATQSNGSNPKSP
ncbi:MAG: hypothetical protein ABIS14_04180 [Sphingomonas sp.]